MPYKVIRAFRDIEDDHRVYRKGDTFPSKGKVSKERISELSSTENKVGKPLIEQLGVGSEEADQEPEGSNQSPEESEFPKHTGGPWYVLSNGEKIQGKEEAIAAEAELK
ncbi:hypothetical protein AS034_05220 [[Bacillus] enclensis]|uniref:Uncharacterized protein n=2 Tax=Rossellomorea TaxID=2837508 RepID=A0A1J6WGQ3_9BACI|nr:MULTISPECIES: hypothetical protein [Rossellomorea]KSU63649.1 hypothetical protein AS034_05220 [[Bacillus] enclensis]OIU71048.1 hypothetical protein BHE18_08345 [Rossellomorea aquimaris]SCB87530.1 hypothetical protein GA0061094_1089 [[Bacillus] enclensis]